MRVVAGYARGHKLSCIEDKNIRPTADRVKEAIFSTISHEITGGAFLDLFSGSGAIGIEALSRGAKRVVFVESETSHVKIIEKNVEHVSKAIPDPAYKIIQNDAVGAIRALSALNEGFDIIFMDPPYKKELWHEVLVKIYETNLLNPGGIIIIEMAKEETPPLNACFHIFKDKHYGKTSVYYMCILKEQ